eukprot:s1955_g7.t1
MIYLLYILVYQHDGAVSWKLKIWNFQEFLIFHPLDVKAFGANGKSGRVRGEVYTCPFQVKLPFRLTKFHDNQE